MAVQHAADRLKARFRCPSCETGIGLPRRVTSKDPNRIVIRLECLTCPHHWDIRRILVNGIARFDIDDVAVNE